MKSIAERIAEGLEMRGMKQADLVEKTGIGKSSISTYLSGSYEPKQRNIYKIASALNVSEAWLMGYDISPERKNKNLTDDEIEMQFPNTEYKEEITLTDNEAIYVKMFRNLNKRGKRKVLENIKDLMQIPDYQSINMKQYLSSGFAVDEDEFKKNMLNAAHAGSNPTEEDIKKTNEIMNNDKNQK